MKVEFPGRTGPPACTCATPFLAGSVRRNRSSSKTHESSSSSFISRMEGWRGIIVVIGARGNARVCAQLARAGGSSVYREMDFWEF